MKNGPITAEDWRDRGACAGVSVELFFPPAEQEADEAKYLCEDCVVREPCLEYALRAEERFGVWGGLTPQERRALVARRKRMEVPTSEVAEPLPTSLADGAASASS